MTTERSEAERAESDRRRIRQIIGFLLAAAAVTAVWVVAVLGGGGGTKPTGGAANLYPRETLPPPSERVMSRATAKAGCTLRRVSPYVGASEQPPPIPTPDGIYDKRPPDDRLGASIGLGHVVFQFAPETPAKVRGQLKALVQEDPRHVILVPNPALSGHFLVGAQALRRVLSCTRTSSAMFDALRDFRTDFRGMH
jgi:hypothetical protein